MSEPITTPGTVPDPADFNQERCLQALAGLNPECPDGSSRAGRLLRAMVLAEMQEQPAAEAQDQALVSALRQRGAFRGHQATRKNLRARLQGWLRDGWRAATTATAETSWSRRAGAVSLAMALLATGLLRTPEQPVGQAGDGEPIEGEAPTLRGAEQAQTLAVADPAAQAAELQALLQAEQVKVWRQPLSGGQVELQALLPPTLSGSGREALGLRGVLIPAHGRLWLILKPMP